MGQRFYPSAEERSWASEQRRKLFPGPLVAIAPTGSGGPKTWPHVQRFMDLMAQIGVYTVVLGELRQDYAHLSDEEFGAGIARLADEGKAHNQSRRGKAENKEIQQDGRVPSL